MEQHAEINSSNSLHTLGTAKRFRELRFLVPEGVQTSAILSSPYANEIQGKIINMSRFGARVHVADKDLIFRNDQLFDLRLEVLGEVLYNGKATVSSEALSNQDGTSLGLRLFHSEISVEKVQSLLGLQDVSSFAKTSLLISRLDDIDPQFKVLFSDFLMLFASLNSELDEVEMSMHKRKLTVDQKKEEEYRIITFLNHKYSDEICTILTRLSSHTKNYTKENTQLHKEYVRAVAMSTLIERVPFIHRAYVKPQGYAGDFGLMAMLYDYSDQGEHLRDKFWHRYACNSPAAAANKNRVELISREILKSFLDSKSGDTVKITSVACGPAKEIELFLAHPERRNDLNYEIVLVDQDPKALELATTALKRKFPNAKNITIIPFQDDAVMGFVRQRPFVENVIGSNLIISAGLFDYLGDRIASKLIGIFYKLLVPNGSLLVGNVSDANPDTFAMDYLMDWSLILRSEADLIRLADEEIKQNREIKIDTIAEPLDLNLFLRIKKVRI